MYYWLTNTSPISASNFSTFDANLANGVAHGPTSVGGISASGRGFSASGRGL